MEISELNGLSDANWFSLEQSIEAGNVIPVVGPDALMVEIKDKNGDISTESFYRLVTLDLLKAFQLDHQPELLDHTWSLHKAVTAILTNKSGPGIEQRVRREVSRLITYYSEASRPAESLRLLAGIPTFSLFVSLTPDNLLQRAMTTSEGATEVCISAFSPRDASESVADLSILRQGERGIFQILGACTNVGSGFAMHEEDAVEYLYRLHSDSARRFGNILSELRRRDLLFIGCNFPDWLGRTMLRLVNDNRFYAKDTQEFLCPSVSDAGLSSFLTQYSPNTLGFEGQPEALILKLANRFNRAPLPQPQKLQSNNQLAPTAFVSYASENAEPARQIADILLNLGFRDVWLDKKKLIGGDDWSDRIDEAIIKSDFFIPILSQQADSRREGVFWDEWKTALERARRIKDAYLLPVCIDKEPPSKSRYRRISDGDTAVFFDKHLIHAPNGELRPEDRDALSERCRRFLEDSHG
ncbi:toll/interleukin-1 receptor domain-containing protein [Methyloglobulus morosus]|uniref:toll/interleukin-1 receptor domain-containing protein n=1 Tax=Methyloglobulus morosus TaxID=1410681 RepID=UPI00040203F4|nr:toll/interleukin-1 receptor domain-containing protein [Methyloglobulus morosus]